MPFKIVQTIEQGTHKLTAVPEQWERNGVLYWPSASKEHLRKEENSVVKYNKWSQMQCIVKRKNIATFYEAEGEIDVMSNHSETETDTENQPPNKIKRLPEKNFNDMAESASRMSLALTKTQFTDHNQCIAPTRKRPFNADTQIRLNIQDASASVTLGTEITKENDLPIININEKDLIFPPVIIEEVLKENKNVGTVVVTETEAQTKSILEEMKTIKCDIQTIKNDIQTVTENQTILFSNQNTIIAQISELSIKFEDFIKLSLTKKTHTNPGISGNLKIYNQKTLEEFERKLDEPDSIDEVYRQYSVILNHGVGSGTTNAYTLVDAMFDRKFFTECSWTGATKGDATKVCFKSFTKTINFFFSIVHESDPSFNKAQLTKFFKVILRNSRYRSQKGQTRMSAQRQKQTGNKLKKKKSRPVSSQDNLENPSSENEDTQTELRSVTYSKKTTKLSADVEVN